MTKTEAIKLLGGTSAALARAIGITPASASEWPELLPPRLSDRVQAALYRRQMARRGKSRRTPQQVEA